MAELKTMGEYVQEFSPAGTKEQFKSIAFVIGAVSVGNPGMENDLSVDQSICIASQGLSAACVCSKVCQAYENHWGVVWLLFSHIDRQTYDLRESNAAKYFLTFN